MGNAIGKQDYIGNMSTYIINTQVPYNKYLVNTIVIVIMTHFTTLAFCHNHANAFEHPWHKIKTYC